MSSTKPRIHSDNPSALPLGTRLGEFELLSLLGVGGFGIVYLAFDHALEREVAVKEYMPASLAGRTETLHVSLRSQTDADTFALGLRSFVNEAKLLARFDHPSLLKVHRFWEANGTAYMAMPVMRGRTLKAVVADMGQAPDEAWLRAMLTPLLGAIEKLHSEGVYHRDIAPDNIQIGPDGVPVLLDFGAARRVIGDKSQTLTAILKPAYAPIEQYAEAGSVKQGPWTDLYALGATLHYLLLNRPPPPATTRAIHDDASSLSTEACPGCSEDFLRTIDWMLAPRPTDRPQSVAALREVLDGHMPPPLRRADAAVPASQWDRTVIVGPKATTLPPSAIDLPLEAAPVGTRIVPQSQAAASSAASDVTAFEPPLHTPRPMAAPAPLPAPALAPVPAPVPAPLPGPVPAPAPAADATAPPVAAALKAPATAAAIPAGRKPWWPVALGLGLVAVAAAAFALWPRETALPAPEAAASSPVVAAAASVPESPSVAQPASAALPESTVTTVVVPGTPGAAGARPDSPGAGTSTNNSPGTSPPPAATPKPPATAGAGSNRPAAPVRVAPAPAAAPPPVAATPAAEAPRPNAVAPAASRAPATPPATALAASEPAKPAVASGPEAICEARSGVMYFVCMERECLRSKFQSHNDCQKWRKEAARRDGS